MGDGQEGKVGTIGWRDLTLKDAEKLRDFYQDVVGWKWTPAEMGGYSDFNMMSRASDETVAGICHARGVHADLPPQWLIYIVVQELDSSVARCGKLGGRVVSGPRQLGDGRFAVIEDPAGAFRALFQP